MKRTVAAFRVLAVLLLSVVPASADWNPGDPFKMHYPQLPDLTTTGIDVLATVQPPQFGNAWKILADDFRCTQSGPITDIHIWGSWLNNFEPGANQQPMFKLSIHSDDRSGPYSKPGPQLWSEVIQPGFYQSRLYATVPMPGERFLDPNTGAVIGTDNAVFQYNFTRFNDPFVQEQGKIYWLDVQAFVPGGTIETPTFGWKTTNPLETPHFEDDAVFGDTAGFNGLLLDPPGWRPLVYPAGPFEGQSIDLAFVITVPEPSTFALLGSVALVGLFLYWRRRR